MKEEEGITLVTLVVTIIVLLILAGTVTVGGIDSVKRAQRTSFISEMEMIQAKVNTIYEKRKTSQENREYYDGLGQDISILGEEKLNLILEGSSKVGFHYFTKEELKKIEIENVSQEVLINFQTREVISVTGIEIKGVTYYKLKNVPDYTGHHVEYIDKNDKAPTFSIEVNQVENKWECTLKDITYNSNVYGGTISYKQSGDTNWILNNEDTTFIIDTPGLYDIRLTDRAGNSTIVKQYIYVTEGLVAHFDGENNTENGHSNTATTWRDISGNQNEGTLENISYTNTSGWDNNSILIDGVDDYVQTKLNPVKTLGENMTLSISLYPEEGGNDRGIMGYHSGQQSPALSMHYSDTTLDTSTSNGASLYGVAINPDLTIGKKVNITTTITNTEMKTYVNGALVAKIDNEDVRLLPNIFYIGKAFPENEGRIFKGRIYNVKVYNKALAENEIKANYEIDKYRFEME